LRRDWRDQHCVARQPVRCLRECPQYLEKGPPMAVLADIDADHGDRAIGCLTHGMLPVFGAPCQLHLLAGQEHGRTIPLTEVIREGAVQSGSPRFVAFGALSGLCFCSFLGLGFADLHCIVGPRALVASRASNLTLYSRFMRYSPQAQAISVPSLEHDWGRVIAVFRHVGLSQISTGIDGQKRDFETVSMDNPFSKSSRACFPATSAA